MNDSVCRILLIWIAVISLVALAVTVADKAKARRGEWRISEAALMIISAVGGSFAMLATMLIIRHKTRHIKFMLGIPIIMLFQLIAIIYLVSY